MIELSEVVWLTIIAFSGLYWWRTAGVKQTALAATKAHCRRADVQLLDDALVLHRYWFKNDESGTLRVWRSYTFEFSTTGDQRYNGCIILLGDEVLDIQLEPYRE